MWDVGSSSFDSIMTTFIFTVYLTSSYFGTPEETSSALSLGLTIAGFLIAILAPVTGQRNDKSGRGHLLARCEHHVAGRFDGGVLLRGPHSAVPVAGCHPDFCGSTAL